MVARTRTKYQSDLGSIHRILLTPTFAAAAGAAPTGDVDNDIKPKVSKTNKEHGLRPRGVTLSLTLGTAPNTFVKYAFLPVLTETAYNSTAFSPEATVSIGGTDWTVVSRRPEDY